MTNILALSPSPLSMTSKEVAELTGKRHADVLRDIRVLYDQLTADCEDLRHDEIQQVTFETDERGYMSLVIMPKDFTLTLLTGYDAKARFRVIKRWQELEAAQVKPMSPAEILIHQGQLMLTIERRQAELEVEQARLASQVDANTRQIQQIETATDHFTIIGWHRYAKQGGSLPLADAAKMGKLASKFCLEHDVATGSVPDPRFGNVKTYPKWVLEELFQTAN